MGYSLTGWIEVRDDQTAPMGGWKPAVDIDRIFWGDDKNYPIYGFLFGIQNPSPHSAPVAMGRGLPEDVSPEVESAFAPDRQRAEDEFGGPTWISWGEIVRLNSDEAPAELSQILRSVSEGRPIAIPRRSNPSPGWMDSSDAISNWGRLASILWLLADAYGDDDVRMVIWFWWSADTEEVDQAAPDRRVRVH